MLRRNQLIGAAALALACSLPASAAVAQQQDLRLPDRVTPEPGAQQVPAPQSSIAAQEGQGYPPGAFTERERQIVRDYQRTPEYKHGLLQTRLERLEREAGSATGGRPGQDLRSPDAQDAARVLPPASTPASVIEVREVPSSGFDWGDAGIGAAGMLALFSIAAGSTLLVTNRRRRRGFQVAAR
jgi:hypothetical protein